MEAVCCFADLERSWKLISTAALAVAFGRHLAVGLLTVYAPEDLQGREAQICDLAAADSAHEQTVALVARWTIT